MSAATEYPAVVLVHWPSGPVPACVDHAEQLVGLANFLGSHVGVTPLPEPAECINCLNERADHPEPVTAEAGISGAEPDRRDTNTVTHG